RAGGRHSAAAAAPRMRDPGAPVATPGPRRAEGRAGGEALRHRRRAGIQRGSGPCASSAAQAAGRRGDCGNSHRPWRRISAHRDQEMTPVRFQSLQVRLAVRLAALYVAATAIAVAALIYQAYDTATSLNDRELSLRAEDLARAVSRDGAGVPQLNLSPKLAAAYAASTDDIFAVRDASGRLLAASPPEFGAQVAKWPKAEDEPSYFHLTNLGSSDYYGLS